MKTEFQTLFFRRAVENSVNVHESGTVFRSVAAAVVSSSLSLFPPAPIDPEKNSGTSHFLIFILKPKRATFLCEKSIVKFLQSVSAVKCDGKKC
jgi:hypothetical protein